MFDFLKRGQGRSFANGKADFHGFESWMNLMLGKEDLAAITGPPFAIYQL